jgi:hypothetical protein
MIHYEPEIRVALLQNYSEAHITLKGIFHLRMAGYWKVAIPLPLMMVGSCLPIRQEKKLCGRKKSFLQAGSRSFLPYRM